MRGDNGVCQQTVQASTIAEEAADQLQASEKLIAGKHICGILVFSLKGLAQKCNQDYQRFWW